MVPPALVLTAGLGTRLRPLTYVRAKPAVPVNGHALVRRILLWLHGQGVREAVLNLHHRPETIAALVGDGADLGVRVRYSWEQPVLGSAGGPRHALRLLTDGGLDRFLVVNGDTLSTMDLAAMLEAHAASGALVTMALIPNPRPDKYGGVLVSDGGHVTRFTRAGSPGEAFCAASLCSRCCAAMASASRAICSAVIAGGAVVTTRTSSSREKSTDGRTEIS